jgi:hypothetical protein
MEYAPPPPPPAQASVPVATPPPPPPPPKHSTVIEVTPAGTVQVVEVANETVVCPSIALEKHENTTLMRKENLSICFA